MKLTQTAICLSLLSFITGCISANPEDRTGAHAKSPPETVLVTYHVKPGQEDEFVGVLSNVWAFYSKERLVLAQPHLIAKTDDGPGNPRFVEIFTWVSHSAPEHVPTSVGKLWDQMQSLCEPRAGHPDIEISEVDLVPPQSH